MKIAIGTDHRGFKLKNYIIDSLKDIEWEDVGCFSEERCDYPIYAKKVCELILKNKVQYGILLCGTGVGMAIAANRFKEIYAALAWNHIIAKLSKEDDNANIIVLPADFITKNDSLEMIKAWLDTNFKGGYYLERIKMLE
jgi:ribose 5-phosphate isomerase B